MQNNAQHIPISQESLERKHEAKNPRIRNILIPVGIVVLMTVTCFGIVSVMMSFFSRSRPGEETRPRATIIASDNAPLERTASPHLQINPNVDLKAFRAREETELNSYGWIDRTAGVVRIPVERAMDLILERGLQQPSAGANKSDLDLIRERSERR